MQLKSHVISTYALVSLRIWEYPVIQKGNKAMHILHTLLFEFYREFCEQYLRIINRFELENNNKKKNLFELEKLTLQNM